MVSIIGKDMTAVKRTTCKKCAALLEYTQSEVKKVTHSHDYLGGYETSNAISCPSCGNDVLV